MIVFSRRFTLSAKHIGESDMACADPGGELVASLNGAGTERIRARER
jgi:hypothetical protein